MNETLFSAKLLLMKPREAATALAISDRTLWQMTKDRTLPCVRIGRAVRYDPKDLQAWVDQHKAPPLSA